MRPSLRASSLLSLLLLARVAVFAAPNTFPERDTPVPPDQPVPVVDFVRPPLFEPPMLNPAGTYFAAFSKGTDLRDIVVFSELGTGKVVSTHVASAYFEWVDDLHLILDGRNDGVIDVTQPGHTGYLSSILPRDRYGLIAESGFIRTGELPAWPSKSDELVRWWSRQEDGEAAFCQMRDDNGDDILYRRVNRRWEKCPVDLNKISPVACTEKPDEMFVIGPAELGQPRALQRLDTRTGQLGEVIYRDAKYDCRGLIFRRGTRQVAGVVVPQVAPRVVWLDEKFKAAQQLLNQQFAGSVVQIVSSDLKRSRFTVQVESDREPTAYYLFDAEKNSLGLLKKVFPWFDPKRFGPTKVFGFKARDGVSLEAFLTLPAGATKEHPVPLVVDIHGGPWSERAEWGWSRSAQYATSAGCAVLEVNYRGSAGYDSRVPERDRFDFDKMSNDVLDGVHAAVKTGWVDPTRMAVEGFGFGSYLAMRGVLEEPTLYRCAILFGGIYDWQRAFANKQSSNWRAETWLKRRLDTFGITPVSILKRSGEIKLPVMFIRNMRLRDVTFESQIRELHSALRGQVACVNFGDFDIRADTEAYDDAVKRVTQMQAFLTQHLTGPTTGAR